MILSTQRSAPKYGMGSADRKAQEKLFQGKEMDRASIISRYGPGPAYDMSGIDLTKYAKVVTILHLGSHCENRYTRARQSRSLI